MTLKLMSVQFPNLVKSAVRQLERGFALKNRLTYPYRLKRGDAFILILKRNGREEKWDILGRINNYGTGFDSYRSKQRFEIATIATNFGLDENKTFGEITGIATHVAMLPQNEFYSLRDGDENNIIFVDFIYKLFGVSVGDKFTALELFDIYGENLPPTLPILTAESDKWSWTESTDDLSLPENIDYVIEIDTV